MSDIIYFISYAYKDGSYSGFGNISLKLKRKIQDLEDIQQIEQKILNGRHHSSVAIISFQVFEG